MIFAFCIFSSRGLFWKGDMHFYIANIGGGGGRFGWVGGQGEDFFFVCVF